MKKSSNCFANIYYKLRQRIVKQNYTKYINEGVSQSLLSGPVVKKRTRRHDPPVPHSQVTTIQIPNGRMAFHRSFPPRKETKCRSNSTFAQHDRYIDVSNCYSTTFFPSTLCAYPKNNKTDPPSNKNNYPPDSAPPETWQMDFELCHSETHQSRAPHHFEPSLIYGSICLVNC